MRYKKAVPLGARSPLASGYTKAAFSRHSASRSPLRPYVRAGSEKASQLVAGFVELRRSGALLASILGISASPHAVFLLHDLIIASERI